MSSFKQILCAIDLSQPSEKLLQKAKYFTQDANTALTVLHVVEDNQLSFLQFMINTEAGNTEQIAIAKLNAELLDITNTLLDEGVKANAITVTGKVSESIGNFANEIGADLLLIGAYNHNKLEKIFLGSTALKILRYSVRPTLVIKNTSPTTYQRVFIAVDFSQDINTIISIVKNIAPDAELVLAHFYDIPFEGILNHYAELDDNQLMSYRTEIRENALKQLESIADAAHLDPLQSSIVVAQGSAVEKILFFADDYECDLLVLGKHGKSLTEALVLGSVTNEIINTCTQDILVITHQENQSLISSLVA